MVRLNDLKDEQINLIHGLLVDEEIRLSQKLPILLKNTSIECDNVKAYFEEVKKLRKIFTEMDKSEDFLNVFGRIEEYGLDK